MALARKGSVWAEEDILEVLYMSDHKGMSAAQIARRIGEKTGRKVTRNSIIGLINRIARDLREDTGIGNGTMPARWWERNTTRMDE